MAGDARRRHVAKIVDNRRHEYLTCAWRYPSPERIYCLESYSPEYGGRRCRRHRRIFLATIEADIRTLRERSLPERRADPRHEAGYAGRVAFGTLTFACEVFDMSIDGAQLALEQTVAIRPWTVVTLHIENFGAFHGRVVWSRGERHGIQFFDVARAAIRRAAAAG
jgi:hypothetical protein